MKEKGQVGVKIGYSNPADGWHTVCVQEGLQLMVNEKSGKESFLIPFAIDGDDEDAGKRVSMFINTRDENREPYKSVEKNFANVIANLKLTEALDKAFPGDVSFLDSRVIETLKIKLPGNFCMVKTATDKNGRSNIVELDVVGAVHTEKAKAPAQAKKEAAPANTATVPW